MAELNEITKEELINGYEHFMTVGELKEFLYKHNIEDNAKVLIQRIEDKYFEKGQWGVYLKEGEHTVKDKDGNVVKESLEQYHPAWCCVRYEDEGNSMLFIDLHY